MTFFHAIILGIVEGLSEFLPISSTFHLLFAARLMGLVETDFLKFFQVFIQAGAVLPLVISSLQAFWQDRKLFWLTALGFLPAAIVGLVLHKLIKGVLFESTWFLVVCFMLVGVAFLVLEWLVSQKKLKLQRELKQLSFVEGIKIGLFQALAVIPGVSRSGSLIAGGMVLNLTREQATRFSFLLAVPTIFAASALDAWQSREVLQTLSQTEWGMLAAGFVVSLISAALSVRWLLQYVRTRGLIQFGWYRLAIGAVLLGWLWMTGAKL